MSVKELIEMLSKMDQNKEVVLYNGEWEQYDPIQSVAEDSEQVVMY